MTISPIFENQANEEEKIISPINIFYKLTEKYEEFPELLYLMYEHFPTLAVQKMMFSGFMKNS